MKFSKSNFIFIIISILLISISGFPLLKGEIILVLIGALLLGINIYYKRNLLSKNYLKLILLFLLLAFSQYAIFGNYNFYGFTGYLIRITIGFLAIIFLKEKFFFYYIKLMKILAIISLVIVLPSLLSQGVAVFLNNIGLELITINYEVFGTTIKEGSLILYHFNRHFTESVRNSGPFWEAGAFGGYLIMAFILNTFRMKTIKSKTNFILFLALLTTFSTTAYLAIFIFIIFYNLIISRNLFYFIISILSLFIGYFTYEQIPFLKDKIESQFSNYEEMAYERGGDSRFGSGYLDLIEFMQSPIVGRGMDSENKISYDAEVVRRNNGLTGFLNSWGIILFLFYWFFFNKAMLSISGGKSLAILGSVIWMILNISEPYFNYPLFWALMFYGLLKIRNEENTCKQFEIRSAWE